MTGNTNNHLYTLNTTTGAATRIGTATDFGTSETHATGIATGYTRPADFQISTTTGQITYTGTSMKPGVHTLYPQVTDNKTTDNKTDTTIDDTASVTIKRPQSRPGIL